jgi:hypothetical protein
MLGNYFNRELQRMPAMDIADVAYDYFLANGQPGTNIKATGGETVRMRIINGSATTYFHLEYAGGLMTIVSADGLEVQPVEEQRFLIAVAETYDVLIKIPHNGAYELRATAHDASGYASVWIGNGQRFPAPDVPKPNLYQNMSHGNHPSIWAFSPAGTMGMPDAQIASGMFDQPVMMGMQDMPMNQGHTMAQGDHAATASGAPDMSGEKMPARGGHKMPATTMPESHEMMTNKETPHGKETMPKMQANERMGK